MKLVGSTKVKRLKKEDKHGENILQLEITEVVFVHGNIFNNDYQHDWRVWYAFVPNRSFVWLLGLLDNSQKKYIYIYIYIYETSIKKAKYFI